MTRDQQVARAEAVLDHGNSIKARLLRELDDLENTLRGMRETVESMPAGAGLSVPIPETSEEVGVKVRRTWKLWNN